MPVDAAAAAKEMELPGIIIINDQFFLKVDESVIHLPDSVQLLEDAVASLVIYYYVLGLNYPEPLKFVFLFFESLFKIKCSSPIPYQMKKLCSYTGLLCM